VKDAEFKPTGRQGVYGGFQSWVNRAGRFRSLGSAEKQTNQDSAKNAGIESQICARDAGAGR
jgi:hypothetical protein